MGTIEGASVHFRFGIFHIVFALNFFVYVIYFPTSDGPGYLCFVAAAEIGCCRNVPALSWTQSETATTSNEKEIENKIDAVFFVCCHAPSSEFIWREKRLKTTSPVCIGMIAFQMVLQIGVFGPAILYYIHVVCIVSCTWTLFIFMDAFVHTPSL